MKKTKKLPEYIKERVEKHTSIISTALLILIGVLLYLKDPELFNSISRDSHGYFVGVVKLVIAVFLIIGVLYFTVFFLLWLYYSRLDQERLNLLEKYLRDRATIINDKKISKKIIETRKKKMKEKRKLLLKKH